MAEAPFKRINFFKGFLTTEKDWNNAERYHVEKRKLHNRMFHAPGVVNGNGDGLIVYGGFCNQVGNANVGESCNALHHMRVSGFMSGAGNEGLRTAFGGVAQPARWENFFPLAGNNPSMGYNNAALTHKIMSTIDTAYDDGNPATGSVRCRNLAAYDMVNFDNRTPDWCSIAM